MSRSLKILYCTDQLYKHGGVERVTTTKVNGWVEHTDNIIHLVTTEQKNKPFCYALNNRVKIHDLAINYYRDVSYFSFVNIKKTVLYIFRLQKLIKSLKPDVVVCVNSGPVNLFLPYITKNSITINEYHASKRNEFNLRNSQNISLFKKVIFKLSDLVERRFAICAVLNDSEAKYFSSNNVKVIPNPINIPIYEKHSREKIVVAAGRIAAVKGYDLLIKAWQHVAAMHPDWKLHIYGDGDDNLQKKLQAQLESLGFQESIKFCGVTKNLNQVFFKSAIHVLSSHEESFGMVILEAQACGLPSVAFNCPTGPEKLIEDNKNGFLVKLNDSITLGEKLNYLIEYPEIREKTGIEAIENARKYAVFSVIENWNYLFNKLITR
jgi:glycosyltransferase involved in cell wall biosynthesis